MPDGEQNPRILTVTIKAGQAFETQSKTINARASRKSSSRSRSQLHSNTTNKTPSSQSRRPYGSIYRQDCVRWN